MKASAQSKVATKAKPANQLPKLKTPTAGNVFAAFVADKVGQKAKSTQPAPKAPEAPAQPVRHEQNGRKEYTPGTIGDRIWKTADALQAATPNTPVVAEAVRIALPDVKPASVSAGLSHWRKFRGTMHQRSV